MIRDAPKARGMPGAAGAAWRAVGLGFALAVAGCGPHDYVPAEKDKPAQIVVSSYTKDGCVQELEAEAGRRGVEVKLTDMEASGWELPFSKRFRCTGDVIGPAKPPP